MSTSKLRLALAIIVLAVSLSLLIWSLWPQDHSRRVVPIPPVELSYPTPVGWLPGGGS